MGAYILLITVLALLPNDAMPTLTLWDKLNHFAAYTVFVMLIAYCFSKHRTFGFGVLLIFLYSALIEFIQHQVGREASFFDLLANLMGIITGYLLLKIVQLSSLPPILKPPFLSIFKPSKQ